MTWNFDYTIPSLIALIFFLIFYFLRPILLRQSNKIFFALIITEIVGFFITTFSCYADNYSTIYNRKFLIFLNSFYDILFIARYFLISLFFAKLFNIKIKKDIPTIISFIATISISILIAINPWTDFIYKLTPQGKFSRAKYFFAIYIYHGITIILDFYYIIKSRKILQIKEFISSLFSVLALISCSIMDIMYVDYVMTDMFFLFVIFILFFAFENPDIYIDKKTELFNYQSFSYIIHEYLFNNKKYSIFSFAIKNYIEKKQIYGTTQTDLALKEIGKFFHYLFRNNKKCFYLQNGNFAIIEKNTDNFKALSETILKRFEQPWRINKTELHLDIIIVNESEDIKFTSFEDVTTSYGIAFSEARKNAISHLTIDNKFYSEIDRKTKVTKALDRALAENNLQVYLQPIVNSETRKIVAAEALVRIFDKELGLIPPIEFITMAERNGSIEQLGEQVLNKVCIFLKHSNVNEYGIKWINVNLSPIQCQNKKLSDKINNITNVNTIDHKFIHLEITEDSMIDPQILKKQMNVLIMGGYNFSLDDFGSGFSNVNKVKSFPFNNIKLDMSIIREHFASPDNILPSIVKTFRDKGLSVTAEGVETKEMAEDLTQMGCNYLQGYYFSKPLPMNEFEKFIENNYKN